MTTDERLDMLLAAARDPDPADDGFTDAVMLRVRMTRRGGWLRTLTRPAVLAAAAVLIAGGALAAVRTAPERGTASTPPVQPARAGLLPAQTPAQPLATPVRSAGAETTPAPTPPSFRRGSAEYGYTSPHTAYVVDRGLRLETETYLNDMTAGRPQRVTLTLENLTDQPVALYAPRGCALTVAAFSRSQDGRDSSQAKAWTCAGSGDDPRARQTDKEDPQTIMIPPHGRHVEEAALVLPEPGEWYVVGQCICYDRSYRQPTPTTEPRPTPQPGIGGLLPPAGGGEPPPKDQPPTGGWYGSRNLFTPPIRVQAA